jgi:hypothetical protein
MNMRREKRQKSKAQKISRFEAFFDGIEGLINAGHDLSALKFVYKDSILKAAFAEFSVQKYSLIERIYGSPATTHKILIDECVDPALLAKTHQNLGITTLLSCHFHKNMPDQELFVAAQKQNFRAIISSDYISAGKKDLCGIANAAYDRQELAPQIIIVPQDAVDAARIIDEQAAELQGLLNQEKPRAVHIAIK